MPNTNDATHTVTRLTARKDLLELQRHGFLTSYKDGRQVTFRPVDDLPKRLASRRESQD